MCSAQFMTLLMWKIFLTIHVGSFWGLKLVGLSSGFVMPVRIFIILLVDLDLLTSMFPSFLPECQTGLDITFLGKEILCEPELCCWFCCWVSSLYKQLCIWKKNSQTLFPLLYGNLSSDPFNLGVSSMWAPVAKKILFKTVHSESFMRAVRMLKRVFAMSLYTRDFRALQIALCDSSSVVNFAIFNFFFFFSGTQICFVKV